MIDVRETANTTANTTSDSIYEQYKDDINDSWGRKLVNEFYIQRRMYIETTFPYITLETPTFRIDDTEKRWGMWYPQTRTISISLRLLRDYSWDAVVLTLKHEMAHMVVDEILSKQGLDDSGKSHGELFKKACELMGIEAQRLTSHQEKLNYCLPDKEKIVSRVRKLMALGESNHKEEAESAITKAHELMVKHNISLTEIPDEDRTFVGRPVGYSMKKVPTYIKTLTRLISKYYFVNAIYMTKERNAGSRNRDTIERYVEFYGEPHNLDVAEYVFHFLLMEGEREWNKFQNSEEYQNRLDNAEIIDRYDDDYFYRTGNYRQRKKATFSKVAFIDGVFSGFKDKLKTREEAVLEQLDLEHNTLPIGVNDPLLKEKYKSHYRPRSWHSGGGYGGEGFGAGRNVGKSLTIRSGVTRGSGQGKRKLISA
ncbi:DUF2786 domain-containing protein [bacterium]|nr:MAG: DUF2786 domain-containing protein [bacterium]